jgi:hypothetical protein
MRGLDFAWDRASIEKVRDRNGSSFVARAHVRSDHLGDHVTPPRPPPLPRRRSACSPSESAGRGAHARTLVRRSQPRCSSRAGPRRAAPRHPPPRPQAPARRSRARLGKSAAACGAARAPAAPRRPSPWSGPAPLNPKLPPPPLPTLPHTRPPTVRLPPRPAARAPPRPAPRAPRPAPRASSAGPPREQNHRGRVGLDSAPEAHDSPW